MDIDHIGERFRSMRTKLDLSQKEFSIETGISQSVIADIERGAKDPSRAVLLAIAQKYHVSIDWLLLGIEVADELEEVEKLKVENESLKKENANMEGKIRKLEVENQEVNRELVDRLRQLVEMHNRHLGIT
jgi:transcriptional regulator with XRE-family HTH domain